MTSSTREPDDASAPSDEAQWERPGPGTWTYDGSHSPPSATWWFQRVIGDSCGEGTARVLARFGAPIKAIEQGFVHGKLYTRITPLVGGDKDRPPPPAPVLWLASRLHPEFRRRERTAERTFADKVWREEVRHWREELRPEWEQRNLSLQAEDPWSLDDADLAAHLQRAFEHARSGCLLHFELHGPDMGPIGDLFAHGKQWGIEPSELAGALRGSSPATSATAAELLRIAELIDGPVPDTFEALRATGPDVAAAVDAYLERYGWRIVTSYDVDGRCLIEMPATLLSSLRAAAKRPATDSDGNGGADADAEMVASLRARVPEAMQETFDELLDEARHVYDLRDDNGPLTAEWPIGLLRRALIAVGERLHQRGALDEPAHAVELTLDEVTALVQGAGTPTAAEVGRRAALRSEHATWEAPPRLGPEEDPPPAALLPRNLRRVTNIVMEAVASIGRNVDHEPLTGTGIGATPYRGRAAVAERPEDVLDSMAPGDVLVARYTNPAFNCVLGIAGAVVVEEGGPLCHTAVMARELGIPAVVGAAGALSLISPGAEVEVDPVAGRVTVIGV